MNHLVYSGLRERNSYPCRSNTDLHTVFQQEALLRLLMPGVVVYLLLGISIQQNCCCAPAFIPTCDNALAAEWGYTWRISAI